MESVKCEVLVGWGIWYVQLCAAHACEMCADSILNIT